MKVLIDTNVVLDVLCNRQEFLEASEKIFKLCEVNKISGYLSALSIPNILYVMRKELEPERTKEILDKLMLIFHVADLKADDLKKAAELKFKDYEDAVQSVCSIKNSCGLYCHKKYPGLYRKQGHSHQAVGIIGTTLRVKGKRERARRIASSFFRAHLSYAMCISLQMRIVGRVIE